MPVFDAPCHTRQSRCVNLAVKAATSALLCAAFGAGACRAGDAAAAPAFSTGPWERVPRKDLSALAAGAMGAPQLRWRHAWNDVAIVHAMDGAQLDAVMREATFALHYLGSALGLPAPGRPVRIVLVDDVATWTRLSRDKGLRPDGLAVHAGDDILLLAAPDTPARADRVAHELVHFLVAASGIEPGPALWADEGLAGVFGVRAAQAYRRASGRRLSGEWPGVPAADLLPLADVVTRADYPRDPAAARAWYRQCLELASWLVERAGDPGVPSLVNALCEGRDWREALASVYGSEPLPSEEAVAALVRQRSLLPLEF